jgi:hypothetical protein
MLSIFAGEQAWRTAPYGRGSDALGADQGKGPNGAATIGSGAAPAEPSLTWKV